LYLSSFIFHFLPTVNICYVMLYYGSRAADTPPARYLDGVPIHRSLPQLMAAKGHTVDVVYLFPTDAELVEEGVRHHFVASSPPARLLAQSIGRASRRDPAFYELAHRAIVRVQALQPDIIHFHSLTLNWNLLLLMLTLRRHAPIVLHYHGGYPAVSRFGRALQRFNFRRAARLLFTTNAHAAPFVDAGVLGGYEHVVEFMETSSDFRPYARAEARHVTGMIGDPVFLWAGRLDPIKDPLVGLHGFARIAEAWPGAQLYLYYLTDAMLPELQAFVNSRPTLAQRVHFRGRAPFAQMQMVYNSADFFLQASRREFSGCAVLEAMACGVIPIVTDIPSFRAMTDGGRYSVLFPPGDADALARAALAINLAELPARSAEVRAYFERALSFEALAERLEGIYIDILKEPYVVTDSS
jgi:glycosyltransferase involved in cell wall biosynthesis